MRLQEKINFQNFFLISLSEDFSERIYPFEYLCLYCAVAKTITNQHVVSAIYFHKSDAQKIFPESFDGNGRRGYLRSVYIVSGVGTYLDKATGRVDGDDYRVIQMLGHHHNFSVMNQEISIKQDLVGIKLPNSTYWNGMIGFLQRHEADLIGRGIVIEQDRWPVSDTINIWVK